MKPTILPDAGVIRLRLTTQQASLLLDILFDLEGAIWEAHGNALAVLAQSELEVEAHPEAEARELDLPEVEDLPF